ncbi:hypothetical protein DFH27DRAFT_524391 [Peziza echinospora]|nr:hypothetical protein DFH27DRAFT_524391 [Peziza echinospora]
MGGLGLAMLRPVTLASDGGLLLGHQAKYLTHSIIGVPIGSEKPAHDSWLGSNHCTIRRKKDTISCGKNDVYKPIITIGVIIPAVCGTIGILVTIGVIGAVKHQQISPSPLHVTADDEETTYQEERPEDLTSRFIIEPGEDDNLSHFSAPTGSATCDSGSQSVKSNEADPGVQVDTNTPPEWYGLNGRRTPIPYVWRARDSFLVRRPYFKPELLGETLKEYFAGDNDKQRPQEGFQCSPRPGSE